MWTKKKTVSYETHPAELMRSNLSTDVAHSKRDRNGRELGMTGTWVGKIVDAGFFGGHQGLA